MTLPHQLIHWNQGSIILNGSKKSRKRNLELCLSSVTLASTVRSLAPLVTGKSFRPWLSLDRSRAFQFPRLSGILWLWVANLLPPRFSLCAWARFCARKWERPVSFQRRKSKLAAPRRPRAQRQAIRRISGAAAAAKIINRTAAVPFPALR